MEFEKIKEQFLSQLQSALSKRKGDLFSSQRKRTWDYLVEMGLPTKKSEAFQYVPLQKLYSRTFDLNSENIPKSNEQLPSSTFMFMNGTYSPSLSQNNKLPESVVCLPLEKAAASYGFLFQNRLNSALANEKNAFAIINQVFHHDGLFLYIPPNVQIEDPLTLTQIFNSLGSQAIHPRVQIFLGKGSKLNLVCKTFCGQIMEIWNNFLIDIVIEEHASATLTILSDAQEGVWHFNTVRAELKRNSHLDVMSFTSGAGLQRTDIQAILSEEGAEAFLKGAWLLDHKQQCHTHVSVHHMAEHTRSQQHYKGVLKGESRSSFEGKIYVDKVAQKTEAYQLNNNLVLGKKAACFSKPNLKIHADDVKASHGCTISELSEEEIFYLKSRGIPLESCREFLVKGFLNEILKGDQL